MVDYDKELADINIRFDEAMGRSEGYATEEKDINVALRSSIHVSKPKDIEMQFKHLDT